MLYKEEFWTKEAVIPYSLLQVLYCQGLHLHWYSYDLDIHVQDYHSSMIDSMCNP